MPSKQQDRISIFLPDVFSHKFHYSLIPGHLLGWVFYYTSTNPVDFYVDIWRYTSGEIVDMVHTKQIQPNPTGRKEVTVKRIYVNLNYFYESANGKNDPSHPMANHSKLIKYDMKNNKYTTVL